MTAPTDIENAAKNGRALALSLGVRVFLYRDMTGRIAFKTIHPALPDEHLELIETFEAQPARTVFDQSLPPTPAAPESE